MADETLLSDLCSICTTQKSKYRCPGCSSRTCSLPCYKRHQQWAQCTGKRDPTAYVKKSQLATPAGIDHDFNFLTSIERGLEKAERSASAVGVEVVEKASQRKVGARKGGVDPVVLERMGITVVRAPEGLTRQRENQTYRGGKRNKNITWTVEWIHPDKSRTISSVSEKAHLGQAYQHLIGEVPSQPAAKRRKIEHQEESTNQDFVGEHSVRSAELGETAQENLALEPPPKSSSSELQQPLEQQDLKTEAAEKTETTPELSAEDAKPSTSTVNPAHQEGAPAGQATPSTVSTQQESITEVNTTPRGEAPSTTSSKHHFFLHRPLLPSPHPVLIPVSPTSTLQSLLPGRTILEFPTIYVFTTPTPPVDEFVLEEEYARLRREEERELMELEGVVDAKMLEGLDGGRNGGAERMGEGGEEGVVDERKIVDVLKKDVGGLL